jgi:hypothetical protein
VAPEQKIIAAITRRDSSRTWTVSLPADKVVVDLVRRYRGSRERDPHVKRSRSLRWGPAGRRGDRRPSRTSTRGYLFAAARGTDDCSDLDLITYSLLLLACLPSDRTGGSK